MTRIAMRALDRLGGPKIVLAAIPGGIATVAHEAGVSRGRVSQVLRRNPLPRDWARLLAQLAGCSEWEVYEQLGQRPPVSPFGPLFDPQGPGPATPGEVP
jgi:hypothetical protein